MRFRKTAGILLLIMLGSVLFWLINFPMYKKKVEERIGQYIETQGIDKSKLVNGHSFKDFTQGRWQVYYQYEYDGPEDYEIVYRYIYDRKRDRVYLVIVDRGVPLEIVPSEIGVEHDYSEFPPVLNGGGWTSFDHQGNILLNSK